MSKLVARAAPERVLARILEQPALVEAVRALEPAQLLALINRVGLEDAGEVVALATVEQLKRVFDDDVWRSVRAGEDERFDPARFSLWLEVMLEAGDAFVADKLAELPEDLVTLAVQRLALVIDLDALAVEMAERGDDDLVEKALESGPFLELGEYRVIARRHDGWDALAAALAALDERHHELCDRMLARCCHASREYIDNNGGLYRVLTSDEMLEEDAAADREERRARAGFVSPSAAKAFLELAKRGDVSSGRDPMTRAALRRYQVEAADDAQAQAAAAARAAELLDLVEKAPAQRTLTSGETPFRRAMQDLAARDPALHDARMRELGYLANVLVAGATIDGRRYRPSEAAEAALAACDAGLAILRASERIDDVELLAGTGCDLFFRLGWSHVDARRAR